MRVSRVRRRRRRSDEWVTTRAETARCRFVARTAAKRLELTELVSTRAEAGRLLRALRGGRAGARFGLSRISCCIRLSSGTRNLRGVLDGEFSVAGTTASRLVGTEWGTARAVAARRLGGGRHAGAVGQTEVLGIKKPSVSYMYKVRPISPCSVHVQTRSFATLTAAPTTAALPPSASAPPPAFALFCTCTNSELRRSARLLPQRRPRCFVHVRTRSCAAPRTAICPSAATLLSR